MDLETARRHIQAAVEQMRSAYLKPVFDEWAILAVPVKTGGVVAYAGSRADVFRRDLPNDAEPLRAITAGKTFTEGDIEFVPDAADTRSRLRSGRTRLATVLSDFRAFARQCNLGGTSIDLGSQARVFNAAFAA